MATYIDPKKLDLQDAAGMQLAEIIRGLGEGAGGDVPQPYDSSPKMDGSASAGSSSEFARGDHVHPKDTSKADVTDLNDKADKITEVSDTSTGSQNKTIDANKIYHFTGALTALTIQLNAPASGELAWYHFDFLSGATALTLTMPQDIKMPDDFAVEANKRYEVDILNNYGAVMVWSTT